ncbi:unnamed protein product, partial [Protopolystoma xenopodis]
MSSGAKVTRASDTEDIFSTYKTLASNSTLNPNPASPLPCRITSQISSSDATLAVAASTVGAQLSRFMLVEYANSGLCQLRTPFGEDRPHTMVSSPTSTDSRPETPEGLDIWRSSYFITPQICASPLSLDDGHFPNAILASNNLSISEPNSSAPVNTSSPDSHILLETNPTIPGRQRESSSSNAVLVLMDRIPSSSYLISGSQASSLPNGCLVNSTFDTQPRPDNSRGTSSQLSIVADSI